MPPAAQVKPKSDKAPSKGSANDSARPTENALEDQGDIPIKTPTINNVGDLEKGIIKVSKNNEEEPYTIVLLGETGVGKSSILELISNVLDGNDIDHYNFEVLDHKNEQGNQSQTEEAHLYELTCNNGMVVRILDTPGFTDTRRPQQDEAQKNSIATQVKTHISSVTAVLVLANGTLPGVTVGTNHALSSLSAIFPQTAANNVAFVLTNVSNPLHQNFSRDSLPNVLKAAPQFLFNNPLALQRKHLGLKDDSDAKKGKTDSRAVVEAEDKNAREVLQDIFDWLGGLEQQRVMRNVSPQGTTKTSNHTIFALVAGGTQVLSALAIAGDLKARPGPLEWARSRWEGSEVGLGGQKLLRRAEEMVHEGVGKVKQVLVRE